MRPALTAILLIPYCFTVAMFTGCRAEQAAKFGHSFASLEEFENALHQGNYIRFIYAPDSESERANLIFKKSRVFEWLDENVKEGVEDWEMRMEALDYYRHGYQTHYVIEEFLVESLIEPDGAIVVRHPNKNAQFQFLYFKKDREFYLRGVERVLSERLDPNRILGVDIRLQSDHLDHIDFEWRFSAEGVPITRYSRWKAGDSGGWSHQGDEFLELKIMAASDKVQIDRLSVFQVDDTKNHEKEYKLNTVEGTDHIRVLPKPEE